MNEEKSIISKRINQMRKELNLTQEELALKLGLKGKSSIANYESGKITPSDEIKLKMCDVFNCTMDYLMGKTENKTIDNISIVELRKYYEEQANVVLKNKYINEFLKLNLTNVEINNLIEIISSEKKLTNKNNYLMLDDIFSVLSLNHNEYVVNQVKCLIKNYYQEKLNILEEKINATKKQIQNTEKRLTEEHIDELHPIISGKTSASLKENLEALIDFMHKNGLNKSYLCPVYGQISAGQPNWAEENIEGTLPIDPNLMNIINPEECFFLRIHGESMNKVVKNGAFALIRKQDMVENGEIAVVLVNGYDATLKKFTKQGDLVILEPQSDDESFKTQVYDKNTRIQILGKYIGKMEFNK